MTSKYKVLNKFITNHIKLISLSIAIMIVIIVSHSPKSIGTFKIINYHGVANRTEFKRKSTEYNSYTAIHNLSHIKLICAMITHLRTYDGSIIEIGIFKLGLFGWMSLCSNDVIIGVDAMEAIAVNAYGGLANDDIISSLSADLNNFIVYKMLSEKFTSSQWKGTIKFIHIDGGHDYITCYNDLKWVIFKRVKHSVIVVDNFLSEDWIPVTKCVLDLLIYFKNSELYYMDSKIYIMMGMSDFRFHDSDCQVSKPPENDLIDSEIMFIRCKSTTFDDL